jgi:hypothetical protein
MSELSILSNESFNKTEIILNIISLIREHKNYAEAAKLIKENDISVAHLARNTLRISMMDLAYIADIYKDNP